MGIYNSKPIMDCVHVEGLIGKFNYCSCSVQGWRKGQEDSYRTIANYTKDCSFFGIFDGHGGGEVSKLTSSKFPEFLEKNENYQSGNYSKALEETFLEFDKYLCSEEGKQELMNLRKDGKGKIKKENSEDEEDIERLFKEADMPLEDLMKEYGVLKKPEKEETSDLNWDELFEDDDSEDDDDVDLAEMELQESSEDDSEEDSDPENESVDDSMEDSVVLEEGNDSHVAFDCGTTAVVALMLPGRLVVANAGDSRCVVSRTGKCVAMSEDHKPEDERESKRISNAGSVISFGRVDNGLNLSRALGDWRYKETPGFPLEEQAITSFPDLKELEINEDDEFMFIATDGIWNSMSSDEVIHFLRYYLKTCDSSDGLTYICEKMFNTVLSDNTDGDGCGCDNMTCTIVLFKDIQYFKDLPSLEEPVLQFLSQNEEFVKSKIISEEVEEEKDNNGVEALDSSNDEDCSIGNSSKRQKFDL